MRRIHWGVQKKRREEKMNSHIRTNSLTGVRNSAHDDVEGRGEQSGDHSLIIQATSAARATELLRGIEADANSHDRVLSKFTVEIRVPAVDDARTGLCKILRMKRNWDTGKFMMFTDQQSRYEDIGTYELFVDDRQHRNGFHTALSSTMRNVRPPVRILNVS